MMNFTQTSRPKYWIHADECPTGRCTPEPFWWCEGQAPWWCDCLERVPEVIRVTREGMEPEIYAAYPGDPEEDGRVPTLLFSRAAWLANAGPEAELDADGDAAFFNAEGRHYQWGKVSRPTSTEEARGWILEWAKAVEGE